VARSAERSSGDRRRTREYWTLVQAAAQPVRILISFAQIVGQLGQVPRGGLARHHSHVVPWLLL
jgi:hypothetical protein